MKALHRCVVSTLFLVSCSFLVACPTAKQPATSSKNGPSVTASAYRPQDGITYVMHAANAAQVPVRLDLSAETRLFAGFGGERWLEVFSQTQSVRAATQLLPEPITAAMQLQQDRFVFASKSGLVYETKGPLGPVVRTLKAPKPFRNVVAGRSALLGISLSGEVFRSTDGGQNWTLSHTGEHHSLAVQAVMNQQGQGLLLFAPQKLLQTDDDGAHWQPALQQGVGAKRVLFDANGELTLEGIASSAVLRGSPLSLQQSQSLASSATHQIKANSPSTGLRFALAMKKNQAVVQGENYFELISDGPSDGWSLFEGNVRGEGRVRRLPQLRECEDLTMAARGSTMVFVCNVVLSQKSEGSESDSDSDSKSPTSIRYAQIWISEDSGRTMTLQGKMLATDGNSGSRAWVGTDKTIFIEGACKVRKSSCNSSRLHVLAVGAKKPAMVQFPMNVSSILFMDSFDKHVYLMGRVNNREGSESSTILLVSHDYGQSFQEVKLERLILPKLDVNSGTREVVVNPLEMQAADFGVDSDGALSFVVQRPESNDIVFRSLDHGQSFSSKMAPMRFQSVSAVGKFVFGVSTHTCLESVDGGEQWRKVSCPNVHQMELSSEEQVVRCASFGCFIGKVATRIGWNDKAGELLSPGNDLTLTTTRTAHGLECSMSHDSVTVPYGTSAFDLQRLDFSTSPPQAHSIRGASASYQPTASVWFRFEGNRPGITEENLGGAGSRNVATGGASNRFGEASIRFTVKRISSTYSPFPHRIHHHHHYSYSYGSAIDSRAKVDVDLAWRPFPSGKVHRVTLHDVGPLNASDLQSYSYSPRVVFADGSPKHILSVFNDSLFVRLFGSSNPQEPLFLVHPDGRIERFNMPLLPSKDARGQSVLFLLQMRLHGDQPMMVASSGVEQNIYYALYQKEPMTQSWTTGMVSLLPGEFDRQESRRSFYLDALRGSLHAHLTTSEGVHRSFAVELDTKQPSLQNVLPSISQAQLDSLPKACPVGKRGQVIAPFVFGARHFAKVASSNGKNYVLVSGDALLDTDAGKTCLVGMEFRSPNAVDGKDSVLFVPGADPTRSVFVHGPSYSKSIEAVHMTSCRWIEPTAIGTVGYDVPGLEVRRDSIP